jgi:uncharacterized protein
MKTDPRLAEFVRLFNNREFFRAHEVLEELWLETHGELRDFYKGLIQCAVAFLHAGQGNAPGAISLYERSKYYLARYPEECQQIQLARLRAESENFFSDFKKEIDLQAVPPKIKVKEGLE